MDGGRLSDFSIARILSPQLGRQQQQVGVPPDGYLRRVPGGFSLDSGSFRPPAPVPAVPVPVPGCLQYRGMSFGDAFCPYGAGCPHPGAAGLYPSSGVYLRCSRDPADVQPVPCYHGYHQAGVSAQPQPRQKARMRTVFTGSQTQLLEALFELTDYPTVEARAEVARSTGLSEETIRVWFKNRRARRKRQHCGSKVTPPSPPRGAQRKLFTSFL